MKVLFDKRIYLQMWLILMSENVFASNTIFGCFYFRYYHCTDTASIFPLRLSQFHIRLPRLGLYMRKAKVPVS